jgi:ubiquinone/menaquinone biosynthesis C-methylase UbiE
VTDPGSAPTGGPGPDRASYAAALRATFDGLDPVVDDLLLLERHEVSELFDRAPARELAGVLHSDPRLRRFLLSRCPEVEPRMDALLAAWGPVGSQEFARCAQAVVWEVADLIAYERAPDLYDQRSAIPFDAAAVDELAPLAGATAADVGAGTGRVTLGLAPHARLVFAVEPVAALRQHLRGRIAGDQISNVLVLDGRLDDLPLETGRVDVLVTCHALGWNLHAEVAEITRVLRPSGTAVHLFASPPPDALTSGLTEAGYLNDHYQRGSVALHRWWTRKEPWTAPAGST